MPSNSANSRSDGLEQESVQLKPYNTYYQIQIDVNVSTTDDAYSKASQFYTKDSSSALNSGLNMMRRGKEIVCLIALLLTAFATIQNTHLKFERVQAPKSLFPKGSVVQDWSGGQLEMLQSRVALSEVSLVFFYAPWCAESAFAKNIYEKVARVFHEEVHFAAVNCWQPVGECRLQYSKVNAWPVLMAYYKDGAVQYTGPWSASAVKKFIENLLTPAHRLSSANALLKLKSAHNAVLVGFFQNIKCNFLLLYIKAALKWLEYDPFQDVIFTIITGSTAEEFNVSIYPAIRLYLWNETMNYSNIKWSVKNITNWTKKLVKFNYHWIDLPGRKSSVLVNNLKKSPTVLIFTPRDYILNSNVDYFLIKQAAWEYSTCGNNTEKINPNYRFIMSQGAENWEKLQKLNAECKQQISGNFSSITRYYKIFKKSCPAANNYKYIESIDTNIFMVDQNFDTRNAKELLRTSRKRMCNKTKFMPNYLKKILHLSMPSFYGMGCKYDNPLKFMILDSLLYKDTAKRLFGESLIDITKTAVLILDNASETTYRMNASFSALSLHIFIKNFHDGNLKRQQSNTDINLKLITSDSSKAKIAEVDFSTVKNLMKLSKSTLVVLFYSSQCAFCSLISQTLMKIAALLKPLDITYLRIDGDKQELPWEYVMESYPALILVPQNKTMESRMFPQNIEINTKNIFGFIVANLSSKDKIQALAEFCHTIKVNTACWSCISIVRKETVKIIEETLHVWRKFQVLRSKILRRLQILLEAYILLFKINDSCDMTNFKKLIIDLQSSWKE